MNKQPIKAIVFDLGGVVMHGGYLDFVHHYVGAHLPAESKKRILQLEHEVNLGRISEKQFYQRIEKEFQVHLTPKQMHERIVGKMKTNKKLIELLKELKPVKLALFTNSIGYMARDVLKQRRVPVKKLFNRVFYSNVIHHAKPAQQAYEFVVKNLKVTPSQALMVDDRKENIQAAKKVGMRGVVFKSAAQFKKQLKKYYIV